MDISGVIDTALGGDVKSLKQAHKDNHEELQRCIRGRISNGSINLLHSAATTNNCEFLREALKLLPEELVLDLICQTDSNESNPIHCAAEEGNISAVKLLVSTYVHSASAVQKQHTPPFFMKNSEQRTPLLCCFISAKVQRSHEHVARHLVSVDQHLLKIWKQPGFETPYSQGQSSTTILDKFRRSIMFCAMREGFSLLVKQMLETYIENKTKVNMDGWFRETPLHYGSKCKEDVSELLLKEYPELIGKVTASGSTVLSRAVRDGATWLVKLMLLADEKGNPRPWNKACRKLIWHTTPEKSGADTALHIAARKGCIEIAKIIVRAYESMIEDEPREWLDDVGDTYPPNHFMGKIPWGIKNANGSTPLILALKYQHDNLGVGMLLLEANSSNDTLLEGQEWKNVFKLAIAKNCRQSAKTIFDLTLGRGVDHLTLWAMNKDWEKINHTVLNIINHIARIYRERGEMLTMERLDRLEKLFSDFRREPTTEPRVYLEESAVNGEDWLVKLFLEANMYLIQYSAQAFQKACEKGHMPTILAFINHTGSDKSGREFRIIEEVNPLHHIKAMEYKQCKVLLEMPELQSLTNNLDIDGDTPLHRAIRDRHLGLITALVETKGVDFVLKSSKDEKTALDLIEEQCRTKSDNDFWFKTCRVLMEHHGVLGKIKNLRGSYGATPLHLAIEWGDFHIALALLMTKDIDLTMVDNTGKTALDLIEDLCIQNHSTSWLEIYHKALARIETARSRVDSNGKTTLHRAIDKNARELLVSLTEVKGIKFDIPDNEGNTALKMIEKRCATKSTDEFWFVMYKDLLTKPDMLHKPTNIVKTFCTAIEWGDLKWAAKLMEAAAKCLYSRDIDVDKADCDFLRHRCTGEDKAAAKKCYEMYKLILLSNPFMLNELPDVPDGSRNRSRITTLELALRNKDPELTKALLETKGMKLGEKEFDLLQSHCKASSEWVQMCKEIMQKSTFPKLQDLMERIEFAGMRETLSLVAALIATITFAAGFTVPGGVNSVDGTYFLSTNPAFLVFTISNTVALCCSMVVLFLLLGPMIGDPQPRLIFVHCSLWLLRFSLAATTMAFVAGVYAMMISKLKWAAFLVLGLCGFTLLVAGIVLCSTYWSHLKEQFQKVKTCVPCFDQASKRNTNRTGSTNLGPNHLQSTNGSSKHNQQQQLQNSKVSFVQDTSNPAAMINAGTPIDNSIV